MTNEEILRDLGKHFDAERIDGKWCFLSSHSELTKREHLHTTHMLNAFEQVLLAKDEAFKKTLKQRDKEWKKIVQKVIGRDSKVKFEDDEISEAIFLGYKELRESQRILFKKLLSHLTPEGKV